MISRLDIALRLAKCAVWTTRACDFCVDVILMVAQSLLHRGSKRGSGSSSGDRCRWLDLQYTALFGLFSASKAFYTSDSAPSCFNAQDLFIFMMPSTPEDRSRVVYENALSRLQHPIRRFPYTSRQRPCIVPALCTGLVVVQIVRLILVPYQEHQRRLRGLWLRIVVARVTRLSAYAAVPVLVVGVVTRCAENRFLFLERL